MVAGPGNCDSVGTCTRGKSGVETPGPRTVAPTGSDCGAHPQKGGRSDRRSNRRYMQECSACGHLSCCSSRLRFPRVPQRSRRRLRTRRRDAHGRSQVTRAAVTRRSPLLQQINAVRAATAGGVLRRPAFALCGGTFARRWLRTGFFSHDSKNGISFAERIKRYYVPRSNAWTVGENLAMFGGSTPTAGAILDAWMGSPGHRANLLRGSFRKPVWRSCSTRRPAACSAASPPGSSRSISAGAEPMA